jgi:hypothetical protein
VEKWRTPLHKDKPMSKPTYRELENLCKHYREMSNKFAKEAEDLLTKLNSTQDHLKTHETKPTEPVQAAIRITDIWSGPKTLPMNIEHVGQYTLLTRGNVVVYIAPQGSGCPRCSYHCAMGGTSYKCTCNVWDPK